MKLSWVYHNLTCCRTSLKSPSSNSSVTEWSTQINEIYHTINSLQLLDKRPLRTKKILTILKKKTGGFIALKRALMIEKVHNRHLVEKLEARYQKFLQNPVSASQKPKVKEKLSPTEVTHIFHKLSILVWGKNSKEINDTNFEEFW